MRRMLDHHHLAAPHLAEPIGDEAGVDVRRGTGRRVGDDRDGFVGSRGLRMGGAGRGAHAQPNRRRGGRPNTYCVHVVLSFFFVQALLRGISTALAALCKSRIFLVSGVLYLNTNGKGGSDAPLAILLYHALPGIHHVSGLRDKQTFGRIPKAELAFDVGGEAPGRVGEAADAPVMINLSIHDRLEIRRSRMAPFRAHCRLHAIPETFDWLLRWQRHIGTRTGVQPAIAVGTFAEGQSAFIFPLGIDRSRGARRLCWLGQDLNDYNAPLIAREFSERIPADRFCAVWKELRTLMQRERLFRHDWIELEKMPQLVGGQVNPFFALALATNPSGAHFAQLGDDWKKFYAAKRSSATRRRDRSKRKHIAQFGAIDFAIDTSAADAQLTLEARDGAKAPTVRAPRNPRHV